MSEAEGDNFCKKMRKATREIHAVSDALVNAKLAFGTVNLTWKRDVKLARTIKTFQHNLNFHDNNIHQLN